MKKCCTKTYITLLFKGAKSLDKTKPIVTYCNTIITLFN